MKKEKENFIYNGKLSEEEEKTGENYILSGMGNLEDYSEKNSSRSEEERKQAIPRISNILSRNIAAPKRELIQLELFPTETEEKEIKSISVSEKKEKPINLTATQTDIVLALEHLLTQHYGDSKEVRGYLKQVADGEGFDKGKDFIEDASEHLQGEEGEEISEQRKNEIQILKGKHVLTKSDFLQPITISLIDLCKLLYGETGMKKRERDKVYEELKQISIKDTEKEIKITRTNLDGETEEIEATVFEPLFQVGKRTTIKSKSNEREMEADTVKIAFGGEFVQKIDTEFSPLLPSFFNVKNEKGTRIRTLLFQMLKAELMRRRRDFVFTGVNKAKEKIEEKYKKITTKLTPEQQALKAKELKEAKEKALTYVLSFKYIKSICATDFDSFPSLTTKFYKQLEEAVFGLKQCGLITEGNILRDKREVVFIYNPDLNGVKAPIRKTEEKEEKKD